MKLSPIRKGKRQVAKEEESKEKEIAKKKEVRREPLCEESRPLPSLSLSFKSFGVLP